METIEKTDRLFEKVEHLDTPEHIKEFKKLCDSMYIKTENKLMEAENIVTAKKL